MFSQGHTRTARHLLHTTAASRSEDPSLDHFDLIVVKLPIPDTNPGRSIVWRCLYCTFEINTTCGQFIPESAREHLSQCESDWIDPHTVAFFRDEVASLAFASHCFAKTANPRLLAASTSNSLHFTSYRNTKRR
jgi:hypothetical protein